MATNDDLKLEIMTVRVPMGTLDRIDKQLKGGELRSVFIRKAVQDELRKREKAAANRRAAKPIGQMLTA